MARYRILDQHVKWEGKRLPPGEIVTVSKEDVPIWERLVHSKVAERLPRRTKEAPVEPKEPLGDDQSS